ncbi:MAG: HAD family hydrolase [Lachnospiraceae bacterium]|nr:HAD family hydrolase [Lachnospiraceae bacterium]
MKKEKIDALLLDVDGTLWDSTGIVAKAWTRAVHEIGYEDMVIEAETLKGLFGKTMDEIAEALLPEAPDAKRRELMDKCVRYEQEALENDPCHICYPGVVETIKELSKTIPLSIISNCQSGYIELFMSKTQLTSAEICDHSCFGDTGKGKADNIKDLVKKNGYKNAFYVGDTEGDRMAVREAGIGFIAADYGFGEPEEADYRIKSFDELTLLMK